jgi:hypothetical protein
MTATKPAAAWAGWHRPNKRARWIRLAEAADYHDCWDKLLAATSDRKGGEALVSQTDPNHRPGRPRL